MTESEVTVSIGTPQQVSFDEWRTAIRIKSGAAERVEHVPGSDAFQSLQLGLEKIRIRLRDAHPQASWLTPGSNGFHRVPDSFGPMVADRLETLVDSEIEFLGSLARAGQFRQKLP